MTQHSNRTLTAPDVLTTIASNMAMIRFDRQRLVVDVNDLFAKTMKYRRDEMIGMHHHLFCTPEFVGSPDFKRFGTSCSAVSAQVTKSNRLMHTVNRFGSRRPICQSLKAMKSLGSLKSLRISPSAN
ncbi:MULTISPECIES: hypothetical protein [Exiguobacterium]|uniref:hypothetical protein n=1 Tax=Exiguobacterium TaxID=33986 RepID=UPI001FE729E9|nr:MULTISPECIES: hypothetical protein [Exiguobacterium]